MHINNSFYKLLIGPAIVTAVLLLIPFLAMLFTGEVNWNLFDFIVAGILLFGTGSAYKLITSKASNMVYKIAVAIACASGLFLIWANLAVGILGSEENPVNLIYFGVIAIGLIGVFISNFRANGMAYTMFAMTGVMLLIPIFLLIFGAPDKDDMIGFNLIGLFGLHGFFAVQFVISALLFRRAALETKRADTSKDEKKNEEMNNLTSKLSENIWG